ncbi:hypothetical protein JXO59_02235 [candidate division KSB1 bacterium]|nr:hypothetical protein [candidate division KSB1 bacterium]
MKKIILIATSLAMMTSMLWGQIDKRSLSKNSKSVLIEPESYFNKPVQLIDVPTAGLLRGGDLKASLRLYEDGGMLMRLSVAISRKMMFGISYGGDHIIGGRKVSWNEMPGVHFSYRVVEENLVMPAIVLGLDTQGYGRYWRRSDYADTVSVDPARRLLDRYTIKSRGFFAVVSKGYESLWKVGLHGGVNYSLEQSDKDKDINIFAGLDIQLSRDIAVVFEYDFAMNDSHLKNTGNERGYLNGGFRWAFQHDMFLEFDLKNLLADREGNHDFVRILRIVYHSHILPY